MSNDLRIVFFGTPNFVVPVLESLDQHFSLVGVFTTPDTLEGRKKIVTPSPVKQAYLTKHPQGKVIIPQKFTERYLSSQDQTTTQLLEALSPDLFVVAAYGKIIPQSLLDLPKYGSINIHPSLLPKYRGPSPIQTTLLNGDAKTGVSIILMDDEVDHGPILSQWEEGIKPTDTFESLHHSLFRQAADKLPEIITGFIKDDIKPVPQNHDDATFCEKVTREDGFIDLANPPETTQLDRMIRAYYPWPTVWGKLPQDYGGQAKKGTSIKLLPEKKVQLQGKTVTTLKDLFNGYPTMKPLLEPLFEDN